MYRCVFSFLPVAFAFRYRLFSLAERAFSVPLLAGIRSPGSSRSFFWGALMATYRTIRMAFWNNPAIEDMPLNKAPVPPLVHQPEYQQLCVLSVTVRKSPFETGLMRRRRAEFLEDLEFDGRIVTEDGDIWVCGFIRHQCSTAQNHSPLPRPAPHRGVRRHPPGHSETLPHLSGAAPYPSDRVSLPSGESEREREKETPIRDAGA